MAQVMPRVSIIIPVYAEGQQLKARLQALQCLRGPGAELIVVDGGSPDNSAEQLQQAAALYDRCLRSEPGRALQMNAGAKVALGEWLWFVHLDSDFEGRPGLPHSLAGSASWGYYRLQLDQRAWHYRLLGAAIRWRSRWFKGATGDQGIFVRRRLFEQLGGYQPIPLMEDIELCDRLKRHSRPQAVTEVIITSARRWQRRGFVATVLFMWQLRLRYRLGACPWALAKRYYPNIKFKQAS
ncbi:MAG: TIGR04283 family arsenosugar biosynthesis glycosyltransferase [Cellvibrionaceae bacterium]|nr:TIGR04283 family arsenosugar biosynthesis glycosyltransferase [Cellvibrionaceae bacterium]MCV6625670.1 TIGR04283 family arsenosugar biosynthesis glycosyltransferase [Cellvibrionaceae bacterium]